MKSGKNDICGLHFTSLADFRCTRLIANCLTFFLHSSMIVLGSKTCANNAKVTCYFHKFSFLSNQDNMQIQKRENNDNDYIHRRIKKIILSYLLKQSSLFLSHRRNSEKRWASPILSNKRVMLSYETNLEQRIQEANEKIFNHKHL